MAQDLRSQLLEQAQKSGSDVSKALMAMLEDSSQNDEVVPVQSPSSLPLTAASLKAALTDTFTAAEIASPDENLSDLLSQSTGVMLGGERRLRLLPGIRAQIIHAARDQGRLQPMLERKRASKEIASNTETEQQTRWIARLLMGQDLSLSALAVNDLRAAVRARESLAMVDLPTSMPSLAEFQRRLDLAEILEPLHILIGYKPPTNGKPASDRFAGREQEIAMLRRFVDELESHSTSEAVGRRVSRVREKLAGATGSRYPAIFMLEARGGLGKSSLIAKFVLDHALDLLHPVPFAYFDFDRAALQPRDPASLLGEAIRQLAAQFPLLESNVEALRYKLRAPPSNAQPSAAFDDFRELLRSAIFSQTGRSFLLVLDTMEVVQGDQLALNGVMEFLDLLAGDGFPELRIVASGRAAIPPLATRMRDAVRAEHYILPALKPQDARDMANRLGAAVLGGSAWKPQWAQSIVSTDSRDAICEPLVIRVAVDLVCRAAPDKRAQIANAIGERGEAADPSFVGRLYERRVLDHVRDPYARCLAWPGLVLRRITPEIARDLLAPICGLAPGYVNQAFEALGREVWIVERNGDVLTHRADLRARTLPLMRERDRNNPDTMVGGFRRINNAAIDWFGSRRSENPADRAEWIYHRLLGGEDIYSVDADWSDDLAPLLSGAADDFEVFAPQIARYLQARTSTTLMHLEQILQLETPLALDHVARVARALGEFRDVAIDPVLLALSQRDMPPPGLSPRAAVAAAVIAVKTGRWFGQQLEPVIRDGRSEDSWDDLWAYARRFCRTRMITSDQNGTKDYDADYESPRWSYFVHPRAWMLWTQDIAAAQIHRSASAGAMEGLYAPAFPRSVDSPHEMTCLRTAVIFTPDETAKMAIAWLDARRHFSPYRYARSLSGAEFLALIGRKGERIEELSPVLLEPFNDADLSWRSVAPEILKERPLRIDDSQICAAVEHYLADLIDENTHESRTILRDFMAARNEDWMIPLGYAVARLLEGAALPTAILSRMRDYGAGRQRRTARRNADLPDDALGLVQRADEAGDLMWVLDRLARIQTGTAVTDFRMLVDAFRAWREAVTRFLDTQRPDESERSN